MKTLKESRLENLRKRYNRDFYIGKNGLIKDPMCDTKEFKAIEESVDKSAEERMEKEGIERLSFGACHKFWEIKKEILKSEYGIDWFSPAELNPFVMFD